MRSLTFVVLAGFIALACGSVLPGQKLKYADKSFIEKQKVIFEVFQHIYQHNVQTQLYKDGYSFNVEENFSKYTNVPAVTKFYEMYKKDFFLKFDDIFSITDEYHKDQAHYLFNFFYYAKDWETFYHSFAWARYHFNPNLFVYSLSVAILHRPDMVGFELPAIYEIFPEYFFNTEVIALAQSYKMQGFYGMKKVDNVYTVIIPANYTGMHTYNYNMDQQVSYFTEDIGLNMYYYYYNLDYPYWMGGKEFNLYKDRRGELYFFVHNQILARYYMERLSNGLGVIPEFSFYEPIPTGYFPNLRYYNGVYFPARSNYYTVYNDFTYYDVELLDQYEGRFIDAIDHGFIYLPDGTHVDLTKPESIEYFGNLVQGNFDSVNTRFYKYFSVLAKMLFGSSHKHHEAYKFVPGVLEHYETVLRDPFFYQLYKKILSWYWQFKDTLPAYTYEELYVKGIKIESVEIDKLTTYFDKFDADITNAVDVEPYYGASYTPSDFVKFGWYGQYQGQEFVVKARQWRLNHLPFTVKLNVFSETAMKGVVRFYLGPKYDQFGNVYDIDSNRQNFVLMDSFVYEFTSGKNVISRNSQQFSWYVKDRTTYYELYKMLFTAYGGQTQFPLEMTEAHCGTPSRLMLPKGRKGGMPFQWFFIVTPYFAPQYEQFSTFDSVVSCGVGSGARYVDKLPFGYPFDRPIDETVWYTPNMYYYDVNIFHKKEIELNTVY